MGRPRLQALTTALLRLSRAHQASMPPRRSGRVAAAEAERAWAFPQLPLDFVLAVFALLPADARLRCAEVSRAWRDTVALPALWRRLDLSDTSGVVRYSLGLFSAAVARAGGALTALDVSGNHVGAEHLRAPLHASRGSLVELRLGMQTRASVTELLARAPQLRELCCGVDGNLDDAAALLEGGPPLAPLQLRALRVQGEVPFTYGTQVQPPLAVARALADAQRHPGLARLTFSHADLRAVGVADALADAVVARPRLRHLSLLDCQLLLEAAPALARMLREGALAELAVVSCRGTLFDAASGATLGAALRENRTLTSLSLQELRHPEADWVLALVGALVSHRSLRKLDLTGIQGLDGAAFGATLAALLAADAPALNELSVMRCGLGEAAVGPLCDALPSNSHLRTLNIRGNLASAGFMRTRLLPAVRANIGLRTLWVVPLNNRDVGEDDAAAALEARQFVDKR